MMKKKRIQLTLFVEEKESETIEAIRKKFNPEQYVLIKSHVTLCREDELEKIDKVIERLTNVDHSYISMQFGPAVRFSDGKGVLLPAIDNSEQFQKLREVLLLGTIPNPRKHQPHITLMHPGNSTCTDSLFEQIIRYKLPGRLVFTSISLIEQEERSKWKILRVFDLKNPL